ncbi:imidazole glycerol phosphate synthase subunit HisH [Pedobacter heparinus]|uniref:Imidazole glycerol phosphate synthase subunit HisH n=1 Tax=Pedobacter heparinus (strain ATCC 13125 / DSM 2366 / CIP 104194 / JCM 7457 / NBRC 12017 / NCIMB 9290 / NRRL B-14731 / HIM 762-3) TaxID=485917 RepID=C6XVQ1_PEDHD|nr:imidazole glycerol phosphate synthase subunit HisH [Pedobacter heparinus]ACU06126.1 imidazole glycerol phosphate synthase, glutamine amidotransferase subunit [Pedobacter heparinus DSM 2366]
MNLKQNIVIIDYGVGNTFSVSNAIKHLGYRKVTISDQESVIDNADVLILPGVGAFEEAINNLKSLGLDEILHKTILVRKKPILGICVGMQLMATFSEENGIHNGLNWIEGKVTKLDLPAEFAVPHVGWNNVTYSNPLFGVIPSESNFYFDHSFHFDCEKKYVTGYSDYGLKVTASIQKENVFGVQFHPEKSQTNGLKLFRGFFNLIK